MRFNQIVLVLLKGLLAAFQRLSGRLFENARMLLRAVDVILRFAAQEFARLRAGLRREQHAAGRLRSLGRTADGPS